MKYLSLYLWLTISTVPYCSIQSFPKMMLCTQHIGFVQVYASLCLLKKKKKAQNFKEIVWEKPTLTLLILNQLYANKQW